MIFHMFHMVYFSPFPILAGAGALSLVSSFLLLFKFSLSITCFMVFLLLMLISMWWWKEVDFESCFMGEHNFKVMDNLKWGMVLFILSEVLFFGGWFWGFFHSSMSPLMESWPPFAISILNPFQVPLLNTLILLSSGVSVTWAHHNIINSKSLSFELMVTIFLGINFTILQGFEYLVSEFSISDGVYGGCFFVTTGFHGIHVIIGSMFLMKMLFRSMNIKPSQLHHLGIEFSIWYWHFVDVVWLFLFSFIYFWSSW